jgi:hypothetical protein
MRRAASSSCAFSLRAAAGVSAAPQPAALRAASMRHGRNFISTTARLASSAPFPLLATATSSAGRRFYATADNGSSSPSSSTPADSTPAVPAQPTVSSIISIQTPEEYQKLVLEASKTRPIIVDCYAEYDFPPPTQSRALVRRCGWMDGWWLMIVPRHVF